MSSAEILYYAVAVAGGLALLWMIRRYAKGLSGSPRDLWLLFGYKIAETTAYALGMAAMRLSLRKDSGLSDTGASNYYLAFTLIISVVGIAAGAFTDTLGVKRMTIISILFLFVSRLFMGTVNDPVLLFVTAYVPLALGMAIVAPVVSVGVKKLTDKNTAPLGFALYYILMNAGYAIGGWFFDDLRGRFALRDTAGKIIDENAGADLFGFHFSTYKIIFLTSIVGTLVSLAFIIPMRRRLQGESRTERAAGTSISSAVKESFGTTFRSIREAASERFFLTFVAIVTLLIFVQAASRQFSLTFPDYGVRVLGEGAKVGTLYGVLNPVLILFFVPLVGALTKKVSSFRLIIIGSTISTVSCFIAAIPGRCFDPLTHTTFGEMVFVYWLKISPDAANLAANPPHPAYWPLIFFIIVFTVGEAIWSPRFYQFAAEIAPKGREATYLSLAILPTLASKFLVSAMSGVLLSRYTPVTDDAAAATHHYPEHYMIWVWVGISAAVTPIGMLLLKKVFEREIRLVGENIEDA